MKLIVALTSTAATLLLGAGIYSVATENDSPAGIVTDSTDNPFAGLADIFSEKGMMSELTEEEIKAEEDYLILSPSPKPDPAAADRGKSTTENVLYQSCEMDPYVANREVFMATNDDAMVKRAIYSVVRLQQTLETRDCTCAGKVAPFERVEEIIAELNSSQGENWDRYSVNQDYKQQARQLRSEVEAFCGGDF